MPVAIIGRAEAKKFSRRKFKNIACGILRCLGREEAELSVVLTGNSEMQELNSRYRNQPYATDVLSFPVEGRLPAGEELLGDVIISVEKAGEQASENGHSLEQEIVILLIHGILHLLGYDHERSAKDARIMGRLEKKLFRTLCDQRLIQV